MQSQASVKPLNTVELGAWRGLLRVHADLVRELDAELEREHGLSLSSYEVLLHLHDAPGRRLRMNELADSVLLTVSGITRVVDRLVRDGLVARERCQTDRRGLNAVLTDAGAEAFLAARCTHLRGIRERFHSRLDRTEQERLSAIWDTLLPGASA